MQAVCHRMSKNSEREAATTTELQVDEAIEVLDHSAATEALAPQEGRGHRGSGAP